VAYPIHRSGDLFSGWNSRPITIPLVLRPEGKVDVSGETAFSWTKMSDCLLQPPQSPTCDRIPLRTKRDGLFPSVVTTHGLFSPPIGVRKKFFTRTPITICSFHLWQFFPTSRPHDYGSASQGLQPYSMGLMCELPALCKCLRRLGRLPISQFVGTLSLLRKSNPNNGEQKGQLTSTDIHMRFRSLCGVGITFGHRQGTTLGRLMSAERRAKLNGESNSFRGCFRETSHPGW